MNNSYEVNKLDARDRFLYLLIGLGKMAVGVAVATVGTVIAEVAAAPTGPVGMLLAGGATFAGGLAIGVWGARDVSRALTGEGPALFGETSAELATQEA